MTTIRLAPELEVSAEQVQALADTTVLHLLDLLLENVTSPAPELQDAKGLLNLRLRGDRNADRGAWTTPDRL